MRSARSVASGAAGSGRATADGKAAISDWIVESGSMAMPRTAVTSAGAEAAAAGCAAGKRALWEGWEVKVPRRRKMAEGLSLESLGAREGDGSAREGRGAHAEELEALAGPEEVDGGPVSVGEGHCELRKVCTQAGVAYGIARTCS